MKILGLDLSTTVCGWAITDEGVIVVTGFFNISKVDRIKKKQR